MAKSPVDPLRAKLLELTEALGERVSSLRDYSLIPGNAWLAKGELSQIAQLTSDLEELIEEIKQSDAENGY